MFSSDLIKSTLAGIALIVASTTTAADETNILTVIEGGGKLPSGQELEYFPGAKGYIAEPTGAGKHGSIILIHEWNGLVERVKQVADALGEQGYVALAADLYSGRKGSNAEENMALVRETRDQPQTIIDNLNAAVAYLKRREDSNGLVATIGWCYGGGVALSFALGGEHHDGTAIFYGRLLVDPAELKKLDHEMFGTFAGQDHDIPPSQVESFVEGLRAAGVPNDIHIYDPVQHGFWLHVERDVETNREPAEHSWGRLRAYFERVLGTESDD